MNGFQFVLKGLAGFLTIGLLLLSCSSEPRLYYGESARVFSGQAVLPDGTAYRSGVADLRALQIEEETQLLGEGELAESGRFSFHFAEDPPGLDLVSSPPCETITVSDETALVANYTSIYVYASEKLLGSLDLKRMSESETIERTAFISRVYADRELLIQGQCLQEEALSFDLELKPGWNIVVQVITREATQQSREVYTGLAPSGAKWFFTATQPIMQARDRVAAQAWFW